MTAREEKARQRAAELIEKLHEWDVDIIDGKARLTGDQGKELALSWGIKTGDGVRGTLNRLAKSCPGLPCVLVSPKSLDRALEHESQRTSLVRLRNLKRLHKAKEFIEKHGSILSYELTKDLMEELGFSYDRTRRFIKDNGNVLGFISTREKPLSFRKKMPKCSETLRNGAGLPDLDVISLYEGSSCEGSAKGSTFCPVLIQCKLQVNNGGPAYCESHWIEFYNKQGEPVLK